MEVYVDDETKLTLHGLQQYYCKLKDQEKNRKLFDLLDVLEFNQVNCSSSLGFCGNFTNLWTQNCRYSKENKCLLLEEKHHAIIDVYEYVIALRT